MDKEIYIASMVNLPIVGNLPIEAKGFPGSRISLVFALASIGFLPIITLQCNLPYLWVKNVEVAYLTLKFKSMCTKFVIPRKKKKEKKVEVLWEEK
jgi:hypothetical protein